MQSRSVETFDELSNRQMVFKGVRVERQCVGPGDAVFYYSRYRRDVYDARYSGKRNKLDWDVEGMLQRGQVGAKQVRAWAFGAIVGYTFAGTPWSPRLGLQLDAASGERHPGDNTIGTFNPLFPNDYYFTLAGLTGYNNLIHLKPSLTVKPVSALSVMGAVGLQWRETVADAVYAQGSAVVPRTAGGWQPLDRRLRADAGRLGHPSQCDSRHRSGALSIGDSLRAAGGRAAQEHEAVRAVADDVTGIGSAPPTRSARWNMPPLRGWPRVNTGCWHRLRRTDRVFSPYVLCEAPILLILLL